MKKQNKTSYDELWKKNISVEMEMAVLGAALIEKGAFKTVMSDCRAEYFYDSRNQKIFNCYKKYYDLGNEKIDLTIATEWLKQDGLLAEIGGEIVLSNHLDRVSTAAHTSEYIKKIKEYYFKREFLKSVSRLYDSPDDSELLDRMVESYHNTKSGDSAGIKSLQLRVVDDMDEILKKKDHGYYDTGFPNLDKPLNGMMPGNLITWAARPGVGKSSMMLKIAMRFARANLPVLYFTSEMSYEETFMRMLTMSTEIENWHFRKRYYAKDDAAKIYEACKIFSGWPMFFNDKPSPNIADVRSAIVNTKCKLVIFDYIQRAEFGEGDNKAQKTGNFVKQLKNLCREFNTVGFMGAQMNRETDHFNTRQRPQLADLKDSGDIEQESDTVMLMWKKNKKDRVSKKELVPTDAQFIKPVECIIAKNRGGMSDVSEQFIFREKVMSFEEWNGNNLDVNYEREDLLHDPQNVMGNSLDLQKQEKSEDLNASDFD